MPTETWFWVLGVVAVAALAAFALWRNGALDVALGPKGLTVKTRAGKSESSGLDQSALNTTKVAEGARIGGEVGKIIGESAGAGTTSASRTEVARNLTAEKGSKIGEIIGKRVEGQKGQD